MQNQEILECIWEGTISHIPTTVTSAVILGGVNQMITPVSALKCRVTLVSDDGEEISPCKDCLCKGITSTAMFRRLIMKPGHGEHPTLDFDVLIVCDGRPISHSPTSYSHNTTNLTSHSPLQQQDMSHNGRGGDLLMSVRLFAEIYT